MTTTFSTYGISKGTVSLSLEEVDAHVLCETLSDLSGRYRAPKPRAQTDWPRSNSARRRPVAFCVTILEPDQERGQSLQKDAARDSNLERPGQCVWKSPEQREGIAAASLPRLSMRSHGRAHRLGGLGWVWLSARRCRNHNEPHAKAAAVMRARPHRTFPVSKSCARECGQRSIVAGRPE